MTIVEKLACLSVLLLLALPAYAQSLYAASCAEDGEIDSATKRAIDEAATNFVQTILGTNPASALDSLSEEGRTGLTADQLAATATNILRLYEPKGVMPQHTYVIHLKGTSPGRLVCGADLSKPTGWESLRATDVPEQAYAVLSAEGVNNHLVFTVWLLPERNTWKVQSFSLNASSLADLDSTRLLELAKREQAHGHNFNAALLYAAAQQTADRGPNFQMGITQSISEETAKFTAPAEISGQPPFLWKSGDATYRIQNIGPTAVGGKIYVIINQEVPPWQNDEQVDKWNRDLIKYFKHRFPEYSDVFAGIVARANERGGLSRLWNG